MPRVLLFLLCCLLASISIASDNAGQPPTTAGTTAVADPPKSPAPTAANPKQGSAVSGLGSGVSETNPFTVLLGLGFILALIFGSAWLMRRMGAMNFSGQSGLKIITGLSVGPRERVLLIEAGDKQILIGVASGSVSHLETFDQPIISSGAKPSGDFSQRLRAMLASKVTGGEG